MPCYAVRVEFDFDMDDGDRHYTDQDVRAGAFAAGSARTAAAMARVAYKPDGGCWYAYEWEAVECADDEDALRVAREMEGWDWPCRR